MILQIILITSGETANLTMATTYLYGCKLCANTFMKHYEANISQLKIVLISIMIMMSTQIVIMEKIVMMMAMTIVILETTEQVQVHNKILTFYLSYFVPC